MQAVAVGKHIPRLKGHPHGGHNYFDIIILNYVDCGRLLQVNSFKQNRAHFDLSVYSLSQRIGGPFRSRGNVPLRFRLLLCRRRRHSSIDFLAILYLQLGAVSHILSTKGHSHGASFCAVRRCQLRSCADVIFLQFIPFPGTESALCTFPLNRCNGAV